MTNGVHICLIASLLLAFTQAPFRHTHESAPHDEHAQGLVHAHWNGNTPAGPAWDAPDNDSDARSLDWFAGDGKSPVKIEAVLPESVVLPTPPVQIALAFATNPHNHDPPWRLSLKSRAPPA